LLDGLGGEQPRALLLTHIHLDHAGATGALVRRWPDLPVYVHERGASHLADPSKLIASASRLYGERMGELWGEIVPVPEGNLRALAGGEQVLGFRVAYTPGHASHHVCFLHEAGGGAFVGDVGATRIPPANLVLPPTPPPDIDLEAWGHSLDLLCEWRPTSLGITHFGAIDDPIGHIEEVRRRLRDLGERARRLDAKGYESELRREIAERLDPAAAEALLQAVPPEQQWAGLDRYWEKRAER
jgi:glyoxylase-like metal-dependent hydrolase (beta-lactamase superfamily II)